MQPHEIHNLSNITKTAGQCIGGIFADHIPAEKHAEVAGDLLAYLNQVEGYMPATSDMQFARQVVIGAMKALGFEPADRVSK